MGFLTLQYYKVWQPHFNMWIIILILKQIPAFGLLDCTNAVKVVGAWTLKVM
jgi:hypothetical protein